MAVLFHLVRHGAYALLDQALGGRGTYGLNEQGQRQAARLAAALADRRVVTVASSPVRRAQETAAPIAARLGLAVSTDAAFTEIDFAAWTGQRFDDLAADPAWRAWNIFRSTASVPGGESMLAVQARAVAGLLRLAVQHPDGELGAEVVVVSHADVIKAMLAHFLGAPLDMMSRLEVEAGSISQVTIDPVEARVRRVNLVP